MRERSRVASRLQIPSRSMRSVRALSSSLLLAMTIFGCDCDEGTTGPGDGPRDELGVGGDTGDGDDDAAIGDDILGGGDMGGIEDGGGGGNDGGDAEAFDDGGALDEPLSEFCTGEGTVVRI